MQNLLMILVPFFPALCAAAVWFAPAVREDKSRDRFVLISLIASCIDRLNEQGQRFALIIPGYAQKEPVVCLPGSGDIALYTAMEALADITYNGENITLPVDDIRRRRRKFGKLHLCAWSDVPTQTEALSALGVSRMRVIACKKDGQHTSELECWLSEDLTGETEGGAS